MWKPAKRNIKSFKPIIYLAPLFFCSSMFSQTRTEADIAKGLDNIIKPIRISENVSLLSRESPLDIQSSIIKFTDHKTENSFEFYDQLKEKASKNAITKKLYDLVIVSSPQMMPNYIESKTDYGTRQYSGMRIRAIEVRRLNVFGTSVSNPGLDNPKKIEKLLNKTHINTNENIIRKNLLFSIGDTVSPLVITDNERILRQLPYINDSRIVIVPIDDDEVDIVVITRDIYSLGGELNYKGLTSGKVSVFDKNILGVGHELGIDIPYDKNYTDSPGIGAHFNANNIAKTFVNLNLFYLNGLGTNSYGFSLSRELISSSTKYGGGISVKQINTTEDLDTLPVPEPFNYNLQDYFIMRSFLINKEKVSRIILGARYTFNNVITRPEIHPDSYYNLQYHKLFLGSVAYSFQKYYKTNLIYSYGRTEDIPYGGLIQLTGGKEVNEFKNRVYLSSVIAFGKASRRVGYFYFYTVLGSFFCDNLTEQGTFITGVKYFTNLLNAGNSKIRNFINIDYTRGFDRYTDEYLTYPRKNGFSGFRNDSIRGDQRLNLGIESVLFSKVNLYGFRFAFFGFADFSFLSGTNEIIKNGNSLAGVGIGIRVRNDNMIFNTIQIRLSYFPNPPQYSKINYLLFSGEQLLRPNNFEPVPPSIIQYR